MSEQIGLQPPLTVWAPGTNYPAGSQPWSGTPLKVQPGGTYFTPDTKPAAENANWLWNQTSQGLENGRWLYGSVAALNFMLSQQPLSGSGGSVLAACWDSSTEQSWIIADTDGNPSPNLNIWRGNGTDIAASWTQLGSTLIPYSSIGITKCAITADAQNAGVYWLVVTANALTTAKVYKFSGGSWSLIRTISQGFVVNDCDICSVVDGSLNVHTIVVLAPTTGPAAGLISSYNGSSWTDTTPPIVNLGTVRLATPLPAFEESYTILMWSNSLMQYSLDGGLTWNTATYTFPANISLCALAFTQQSLTGGPTWILAAKLSGGNSVMYLSVDGGMTWSTSSPLWTSSGTGFKIADMAAVGALVVATTTEPVAAGANYQIFSIDGGQNWWPGSSGFPSSNNSGSATNYNRARICANLQGFLTFDNLFFKNSLRSGLPLDQPL
jgi:hypothetical protein